MKVIDERNNNIKFDDVDYGSVFMWHNENFMRIKEIYSRYGAVIANAVYMNNGESAIFADDEIVEPLYTELIIKKG